MIDKDTLPKNWEIRPLGELALEIKPGYPSGNHNEKGEGVLHFRPYNITSTGQVEVSVKKFVPLKSENYRLKAGDVVFNNTNSLELLGKTTYLRNDTNWVYSNHMTRIRLAKGLSPAFVSNYLHYLFYSGYYRLNCSNHVNQASVSSGYLSKYLEVPVPPPAEQERIVAKIEELFSELDAGIESLKTAQQQLKTYRQAVLKYAFEGKLTNDKIKEGELPKGWKWEKLSDYAKVSGGLTKNSKREKLALKLPFLRVANVYFNSLNLKEIHTIGLNPNEVERVKLEKYDLLFVEGNGSIEQIGRVALWNGAIENCVHQNHLIKARLNKQLVPAYVLHFFCSKIGRDKIKEQANSTSGLHTLSLGKISKLEFPFCPLEEQQRIVEEIESRLSVCDKLEETIATSLRESEVMRQSILKRAFEGKLVKAKEIEKPKRIAFYQMQSLGLIVSRSKERKIRHGEMTAAKYTFLVDRISGVDSYYNFTRGNLGPFSSDFKKIVNTRYFAHRGGLIEVINETQLFNSPNPYKREIENAVDELAKIFSKYKDNKVQSHKTELLATVCKVVEDIKSTDYEAVRRSMAEWIIDLTDDPFKNKAEKFGEIETAKCLKMIEEKGWDKKLIEWEEN